MKIGIVGLGDIAKKAYLPVLTNLSDVEVLLCTRNQIVLNELLAQYHLSFGCVDIHQLIAQKPDAIFVTAATPAHYELAHQVLSAKIPLYLDKPISMSFSETQALTNLAMKNKVLFMTGFNRRFVPLVKKTHDLGIPDLVLYQKNRNLFPDDVRRFVVEDFVHVVDTTRYLLQEEITAVRVHPKLIDEKLAHMVVQFITPVNQAVCTMNYLNGCNEEIIEVMHPHQKSVIKNLASYENYNQGTHTLETPSDWQPTLKKRGFVDLTQAFLMAVKNKTVAPIDALDALKTHEICEEIVRMIQG